MLHPVPGLELAPNKPRLLPPNHAIALRPSYQILLVIDATKQNVPPNPEAEDERSRGPGEVDGVAREILDLQGVHGRQPGRGTPGKVEAKVVVADVDGAYVPVLVDEEVDDVDGV